MYIEKFYQECLKLRDPWERDFSFTMGQFPLRRRLITQDWIKFQSLFKHLSRR